MTNLVRLQKIIADAGLCSRREAEKWIHQGLVTLNGVKAKVGQSADPTQDAIKVKGKLLKKETETKLYYVFNKPKGVRSEFLKVTAARREMPMNKELEKSLDPFFGRIRTRIFAVQKLDMNAEGLLLLTNDGDASNRIQKSKKILQVFDVKVKGHPALEKVEKLGRGGFIGGKKISPVFTKVVKKYATKCLIQVVLRGPSNFDLKTYFNNKGFLVEKVTRTAIGQLRLSGMGSGQYRKLQASQVVALWEQPELGDRRHLPASLRE